MNSSYLWDYTSEAIRDAAPDLVAIQPVASVEQHGPHLPLGTDSMITSAFAERLAAYFKQKDYPGIFLPLLPYGKSNEHIHFPGTITFSAKTYMNVLMDIGRSCARAGFQKLVFLNGHGGNSSMLDVVCRELRIETGMRVFALQPMIAVSPEDPAQIGCPLTEREEKLGIHAGRTETAMIMRIRPECVRQDKLKADYPDCFDGCGYLDFSGKVSYGWMTEDVSKTGVVGDPTGATPEEGERWLSHVTEMLYGAFLEILHIS